MTLPNLTFFFTFLMITFTPLDALEISEGSDTTLGRYIFLLMVLSALVSGDITTQKPIKIYKIILCFIFWAFCTSLWSIAIDVTFERIIYLIQYAVIFIVMVNSINSEKKLRLAMIGWIIGSLYIAYQTASNFRSFAVQTDSLYRVSEFGNPNENSFILCYALLFCYLIDRSKYRWISLLMTLFSAYAIAANGSRMGIILFVIAVVAFCYQLWQMGNRTLMFVLIPGIILAGVYILNNIPIATLMRILSITDNIEEGNLANRQNIWGAAFNALSNNFRWCIIGCGWGTFPLSIIKYLGYPKGAHNFYLDVFSTTGIVGLSIICYYLVNLYRIINKTYLKTVINYLLLFLPLISMMSTNWQSRRWWVMMGAFIYLIYKYKNFHIIDEHGENLNIRG